MSDTRPTIQEQIDACRPGGRDLDCADLIELKAALEHDEEVRAAFESSQQLDEQIGEVVEDVAIPFGLEGRLLDALQDADTSQASCETLPPTAERDDFRSNRRFRHRTWKWISTSAALLLLAGLIGYAAVVLMSDPAPISSDDVAQQTLTWVDRLDAQQWRDDLERSPIETLTLDSALRAEYRTQLPLWQPVSDEFGRGAVYRLSDEGEAAIYQFTIRSKANFAVQSVLPRLPQLTTQNLCIGICHRDTDRDGDGDVLVVLVVEGPSTRYQSVLRDRLPVI